MSVTVTFDVLVEFCIVCYKVYVSRHKVTMNWLVKISLLNLETYSSLQGSVNTKQFRLNKLSIVSD